MKVVDINLRDVGGRTGDFDRAWATLDIAIDDGTNHKGSIEVASVISRKPSTTWAELEGDARTQAIRYMRTALAALEAEDVASIRKRAKDIEDKENAELGV